MPSISNSIDRLIDALAGDDIAMTSPTIAGRIEQLADAIEDGDITIGGGSEILRCNVTYTGAGTEADPYVGHIDNAAKLLDAIDRESDYDPIIAFVFDDSPALPTCAFHMSNENYLANGFIVVASTGPAGIATALTFNIVDSGGVQQATIVDSVNNITANSYSIENDVLSYTQASYAQTDTPNDPSDETQH